MVALVADFTRIGEQIDNYAYDLIFRFNPPAYRRPPSSVIVAIDDATLAKLGGVRSYRAILARGLRALAPAAPGVVAIDMVLSDPGRGAVAAQEDVDLARAMSGVHNLVLATDLADGQWQDPLPMFAPPGILVGHARADEESRDGVTRSIALERVAGQERHWALALEAFRLARGAKYIVELPRDLAVAGEVIPTKGPYRSMRIRYSTSSLPMVSLADVVDNPATAARLRGRTVFLGVTSLSAANDRIVTPYGNQRISGVEVHAQAFETLDSGQFLRDAPDHDVLGACLLIAMLAACLFAWASGWRANLLGIALLAAAHAMPVILFRHDVVFPYFAPFATAWLSVSAAASYQHFGVRRQLRKSESDRRRYQQAIHFVTHEMKTPLTAIQGSSELMGRYNLTEDKRKQMAAMINAESKRLAGMIQTFLDVERLSEGQMQLKREPFSVSELLDGCMQRIQAYAARKDTVVRAGEISPATLTGDRELMEYAVYNLLTNAVKYSPAQTEVSVTAVAQDGRLHLSVRDRGMGIDAKDLKKIFHKFYRTRRAEASGESGTGIGLSIVEQIVVHHGGRMEVTSAIGQGSCFTIVLPCEASVRL